MPRKQSTTQNCSIRGVSEILADVKRLAVEYYQITGKPLGVTGEIAEFEAARLLDLQLAPARTPGFDASGTGQRNGKKIQIKGRWKLEGRDGTKVPRINFDHEFDTVVLVILRGPEFKPAEIWEADRKSIETLNKKKGCTKKGKLKKLSVSEFKKAAIQVWPLI